MQDFSYYALYFVACAILSYLLTLFTMRLALRFKIVDQPDNARKIHQKSIPKLGGMAIFLAYFIMLFIAREKLLAGNLEAHHWLGVFFGACLLMVGGFLDDKFSLKPWQQFIFPVLAAIAVIAGGVGIEKVTNPLGGLIMINQLKIPILFFAGKWHFFVVVTDTFTILWLLGMMYTTKLLDALDGLVTGVCLIGSLIIFLFTATTKYYQPDIAMAAIIFAGACLGFLILNWHPAKIFLGEGGSLLAGFIMGVLSIISGGKIAIALLIMGIPILDVFWTIFRRLKAGKNPFRFADRLHLHHRLLDSGLGQRKTVFLYYLFAAAFGLSGLFLQSIGKLFALILLSILMLAIVIGFSFFVKKADHQA